jgi:hypothetical protein
MEFGGKDDRTTLKLDHGDDSKTNSYIFTKQKQGMIAHMKSVVPSVVSQSFASFQSESKSIY